MKPPVIVELALDMIFLICCISELLWFWKKCEAVIWY